MLAALLSAGTAADRAEGTGAGVIHRCLAPDGTVAFQDRPCPPGTQSEPVTFHPMHFDNPGPRGAPPPKEPAGGDDPPAGSPPRDPGDDLVTWEEVRCHGVIGWWSGPRHYPFPRNRGAVCHTIQRTATRRERCRQLDAHYESFRDSTITWSERREELIEAKGQMKAVGCCVRYSRTSLSNARAEPCAGPRAFRW